MNARFSGKMRLRTQKIRNDRSFEHRWVLLHTARKITILLKYGYDEVPLLYTGYTETYHFLIFEFLTSTKIRRYKIIRLSTIQTYISPTAIPIYITLCLVTIIISLAIYINFICGHIFVGFVVKTNRHSIFCPNRALKHVKLYKCK